MDRWDAIGIIGAAMVGGGVWVLAAPPWAVVFWGALLLALYGAHEVRASRG